MASCCFASIVTFGTDRQLMYFMSTILLKENINGFRVPKLQLAYICDTTHTSHNKLVKLCCEFKQVEIVKHGLHSSCFLRIWLT